MQALKAALVELKADIFATYRENVAYPLKRFEITPPAQSQGNCYIYRYINGVTLKKYFEKTNYADCIVMINEVASQLLQGILSVNHIIYTLTISKLLFIFIMQTLHTMI
jgi:hypothetical protein